MVKLRAKILQAPSRVDKIEERSGHDFDGRMDRQTDGKLRQKAVYLHIRRWEKQNQKTCIIKSSTIIMHIDISLLLIMQLSQLL